MTRPAHKDLYVAKTLVRAMHLIVVITLLIEVAYCAYQLLVVWAPDEGGPLLLHRARNVPFELLAARRLYAIEGWLAFIGLALYLAVVTRPRPPACDRGR